MKRLCTLLSLVFALHFTPLVVFADNGRSAIDQREVLVLTAGQREHVLAEMRALLSGIQGILAALAREDMQAVADIAQPLGTRMAGKAEDHLKGVLPAHFMQLGMAAHKDFDTIAALAKSSADGQEILLQLSKSMNKCQACHAHYQIFPVKSSTVVKKSLHHGH